MGGHAWVAQSDTSNEYDGLLYNVYSTVYVFRSTNGRYTVRWVQQLCRYLR